MIERKTYHLEVAPPGGELVDILAVCLMPNHFHFLVREKIDGGSGVFVKKTTGGYTHYYNHKNKRSGVLFQGRTKKILVKKDEHFLYLPYYIFANPIKLEDPGWKEKGIKDIKKTMKFLEDYKWSSFRDIVSGEKEIFNEVVNKDLFLKLFDLSEGLQLKKPFEEWIKEL